MLHYISVFCVVRLEMTRGEASQPQSRLDTPGHRVFPSLIPVRIVPAYMAFTIVSH